MKGTQVPKSGLKAERFKQGKDGYYMSKLLGITYSMYSKKERGCAAFSTEEIIQIANDMKLTLTQVNAIFFESRLTTWQV